MKKLILTVTFIVSVGLMGNALGFTLPDPTIPLSGLGVVPASLHGDFYSYSLPILALDDDILNGNGTGPGNPYYVNSSPGAIKDDVVIGTGSKGKGIVTNFIGMDNAYDFPSQKKGTTNFSTTTIADPDPTGFAGDQEITWDTELGSMLDYLDGSPLVFFWNNNQTKAGSTADEDLFGWGHVSIVDVEGVLATKDFYFSDGDNTAFDPFVSRTDPGDFVFSPGNISIPSYSDIDHNLGANQAAYAIYSPELSDGLAGWAL